jgi:hypothetical protein
VAANGLILGCGRSGTSIFGELFATFPGVRYVSEPHLSDLDGDVGGSSIVLKVPRTPDGTTAPSGCSVELDDVRATVGDPLVVWWQVRHPLDAVCSLRVGIDQGWAHHPRPLDWQDWLGRPLLERCAHHWAVINGDGFDRVSDVALVNRFEEMIRDPRACGIVAAASLGVAPHELGDEFDGWVDRVQDTNNERFVEAETSRRHSRPDHSRRVGRWRENLTAAEVDVVWPIVADAAARFGYDRP